ncbi:hypothetical protein ABI_33590 [Asticcacaulis biprosthecium C19]|uniref:DUF6265 domain-containing protein n=1 Tax=Asticcacaulis biprosthecium C19 TaxID=715226 RepID=F4QQ54_9CAUL|nr:DUF6265 family protein [Asticcacaulis biprosthecium]EGF90341.1 hypothetical protein ABI_33590 [Asticcacaulis biprosthecium C19]
MEFKSIAVAAVLTLLTAPAHAGSVTELTWLTGCWVQKAMGVTLEETWLAPSGGALLGVGRTVRDADNALRNYEFMKIDSPDGVLTFTADPSGQEGASFPVKTQTADEIVFEQSGHDFPQRVVYRKGTNGLHAHIEGVIDGQTKTINFDYERCQP